MQLFRLWLHVRKKYPLKYWLFIKSIRYDVEDTPTK